MEIFSSAARACPAELVEVGFFLRKSFQYRNHFTELIPAQAGILKRTAIAFFCSTELVEVENLVEVEKFTEEFSVENHFTELIS